MSRTTYISIEITFDLILLLQVPEAFSRHFDLFWKNNLLDPLPYILAAVHVHTCEIVPVLHRRPLACEIGHDQSANEFLAHVLSVSRPTSLGFAWSLALFFCVNQNIVKFLHQLQDQLFIVCLRRSEIRYEVCLVRESFIHIFEPGRAFQVHQS